MIYAKDLDGENITNWAHGTLNIVRYRNVTHFSEQSLETQNIQNSLLKFGNFDWPFGSELESYALESSNILY